MEIDSDGAPRVRVLFFAHAARAAGVREAEVAVEGPRRLDELAAVLLELYPGLGKLAGSLLWSIDEVVVDRSAEVRPGQTVGVLPPFSGG